MKFFLCLLALAIATVNAGFLKGGVVGGYYGGAPAVYGGYSGAYQPAYGVGYGAGYGVGYATPVVQHVAPVVQHVAPIVQQVAPVSVVRVAHVPTYSYPAYHTPSVYKTISVHGAPSYGGWYKK